MNVLGNLYLNLLVWMSLCQLINCNKVPLPSFQKLKYHYPGQHHFGGRYTHNQFLHLIGVNKSVAPHDTSSLRLSFTLNKLGPPHFLGRAKIRLSKLNTDSVTGRSGLQYIHHPIAFGPYLADKYGDPSISVLHHLGPTEIKRKFWNRQGILQIISYTRKGPKGHIALWDCDHLYQADDWIVKHSLVTTEFWEAPDSNCQMRKKSNKIAVLRGSKFHHRKQKLHPNNRWN